MERGRDLSVLKKTKWKTSEVDEEGSVAQWLAFSFTDQAVLGSIPCNFKKISYKIDAVAEVFYGDSGEWLEIVDQTILELASGNKAPPKKSRRNLFQSLA